MGPIRSPSRESARHEDAQKRLISATAAAQKRRVGGLAYESPAALRGWRSGEQAGTCSAVLGAAGESRERGRGWPPRAAKAKYRTILRRSERKAVSWLWGGGWLRGVKSPSCSRPLWLLTPFSVPSSPPSLFTVIALVLRAASPAICFSDCLWGGVRQRPTADNGQRRLPTSVLVLDVNASAILRLGLPSTTSRTPPSGVGHVRSSCTTSTTSWRSVAGEYRKSASIPSRGEGSPIPWPGELGRGVWVPRVSGGKGELGSWSERAHNLIAQETAISIQCCAATQ